MDRRVRCQNELQSYAVFEEEAEIVDRQFQRFQQMQDDYGYAS